MPKRTNEFQRLIYLIEQVLAPDRTRVSESAELAELNTGIVREVDVLIEGVVSEHEVRVAVECRDHERPQDVGWIDDLAGKYRDLPVDCVIAVSRSGFTRAALEKAMALRIRALAFDEALAADWPQEFNRLFSQLIAVGPVQLVRVDFAFRGAVPRSLAGGQRIVGSDGRDEGTLEEYCRRLFADYTLTAARNFIDQNQESFFNDTRKRTEIICAQYGGARNFLDADGTRYALESITLHVACPFEFVPMSDRHFRYDRSLVTIATAEHAGIKAAFTFVQVPQPDASVSVVEFRVVGATTAG